MLKSKLFVVAAFIAFAASVFFFASRKTAAQADEKSRKPEIPGKIASYKSWPQARKPEKKTDSVPTPGSVIMISESSMAG